MIHEAIRFIPSDDRETWVHIGMAVKSEMGDEGFSLWDSWSQSSGRYNKRSALSVWRSIKPHGGITSKTLYKIAREHGWTGDPANDPQIRVPISAKCPEDDQRREKAARYAAHIISKCKPDTHPYLDRKGFPDEIGLVDAEGKLVIPMRNVRNYRQIQSVQFIDACGQKKFLPDGAAKNAVFFIGSGRESWLCEGFATGLSIYAALRMLSRNARVAVCFSAANIRSVAAELSGDRFIVADHDRNRVGERYASQTGCPFVMPPKEGTDANDLHMQSGTITLAMLLMEVLRQR